MDVITLVGIVAALFLVIALSEPLADWSRLPYTVVLAIIGTLIGSGAIYLVDRKRCSDRTFHFVGEAARVAALLRSSWSYSWSYAYEQAAFRTRR